MVMETIQPQKAFLGARGNAVAIRRGGSTGVATWGEAAYRRGGSWWCVTARVDVSSTGYSWGPFEGSSIGGGTEATRLDVQLTAYARRMGARLSGAKRPVEVRYSRYADDLTFSVSFEPKHRVRERSKLPRRFVEMARRILKVHGYRLHLTKKLVVRRRHQRQVVTGLVVNERPNLPRALRRKLRAARHHVKQGKPATFTPAQLQGYSALEQMIRAQRER